MTGKHEAIYTSCKHAPNPVSQNELDRDLAEELTSYVDMLAEEKIREGTAPEVAYRQARIELGGAARVSEEVRERRLGAWIDMLFRDLRFVFRTLRRDLGFAVLAVITSGIGIGAATATFSAVNGVLLRTLPFTDATELVFFGSQFPGSARPAVSSMPDFVDWEQRIKTLESVGALLWRSVVVVNEVESERIATALVSVRYFEVFGLAPALLSTRAGLACATRDGGSRAGTARARVRLRSLLIASETALAVVLLSGAGLVLNSYVNLRNVDPGFDPENVSSSTARFSISSRRAGPSWESGLPRRDRRPCFCSRCCDKA